ncbi:1-deoxy-D-xylulose 5-phosphate reductoisomerase [Gluconacetobacter diazotrophicus PA1 5]|uniref:1-deoxy-D-xylulose 5-phosphate reductoisomerase n=2 Tax=Gluconacetobacter diazotrophicus TaxID=33996 RepID=A9HKV5_GLUDA|nr:1-deoxy-D-xylulose-5-phosphate reductoisomerase [Gluconacetobacter diazotrophicus]ACI50163.1 1-deoxy-D-xylulose 5-phosphate reductoisomerase [Gluconacetobacter diazotrophicus PA1 5]MBB2154917.1 1-deoxy-D-xylulose-5-phosphate reductoisomerase [Gluconacetobacter diazotrophicus]TWB08081.1 1-deoxy-D-xylulose 5-phosphate reductoisomerase [Gluconacetobacter diazotrophicus]CAP56090.1 putative 1-deoxy-D-xylulose 5-phosphate reductoisomerase [Gluconacetobacter diazotrophicus PA1 5]
MKSVTVLGSTGSIGCSTVDLLLQAPERFRVAALVGGSNAPRLAEQARALRASHAVIADESRLPELRALLADDGIAVSGGRQAVIDAASQPVDWTMAAITGAIGLEPTLAAVRNGGSVALANKEALVCAGDVMLRAVQQAGATLLPVDSEHNAIFQSMADRQADQVEKIVLTASGGPFRRASLAEMEKATPEAALRHPTWTMGAKITIDSATMFNKGLEVIEAARLFSLTEDRIGVVVHPQSVVHGLVQYTDGSIVAQMGSADMRIPIAHTLAWPCRMATTSPRLDLAALGRMEFEEPDEVRFPALRLARESLRAGGAAPTILSAANEIAVEAFLGCGIGFLDIARVVESVMQAIGHQPADTLEAVLHWDQEARRAARLRTASLAA